MLFREQRTDSNWMTSRQPDESVWDWYLRHRRTVGESINQKIGKLASAQRGYELNSFADVTSDSVTSMSEPINYIRYAQEQLHEPQVPRQHHRAPAGWYRRDNNQTGTVPSSNQVVMCSRLS